MKLKTAGRNKANMKMRPLGKVEIKAEIYCDSFLKVQ